MATKICSTDYTNRRLIVDDREIVDIVIPVTIDAILDKIKQRGYESLTADEKRELFDRSRK